MDVNRLFARAEQSFAAGRLDAARADLEQVERLAGAHPATLHLLALVEKKRGATDAAAAAFRRALALAPGDPAINNNYANLLDATGQLDQALAHLNRALSAAPGFADARYNRALLLQRLGRLDEALAELDRVLAASPRSAKAHSARGAVLKQLDRLGEAAAAYDAALAIEPARAAALHGRARIAIERGEDDASERYRRALAASPEDPVLQLGLAEALEAEGDPAASETLAAAVARRPHWLEGQASLARMRWEAGEGEAFTRGFERAVEAAPANAELWVGYVSVLAAADLVGAAADAARRARAAVGDDPVLLLLEAMHRSQGGELDVADRLFAALPDGTPGRALNEARHRIRRGDLDAASSLAKRARSESPWDVGAWAITGLIWRATADPRAAWLHEQPGLVDAMDLEIPAEELARIAERLRSLHRARLHPIGQSLRGGTQTRGRLFVRTEPEIKRLRGAIEQAIDCYWQSLPPPDPAHPLLRWRAATPQIEGSWSVRLTDGGFHVAHVHPHGTLSSACYLAVPEPKASQEGWLEIGRPPSDLGLDLPPLAQIEPAPGKLALFPSTLYHGTRAFSAGERLTAAFDVVVR